MPQPIDCEEPQKRRAQTMNERWMEVLEGPCRFVAGLILFAYQRTRRLRERLDRTA
jgi:hypothetical protein